MKVLHVSVEADDGWLIAQGLEEPGVITQARTLDQLLANVRDVAETMNIGGADLHLEIIVPPSVGRILKRPPRVARRKAS